LKFFIFLNSHRENTMEHNKNPTETGQGACADVDKK
jgi:hypothetical protein|tara:strand:+ start:165 stop:272 length:108 start_codon:yes stop_codon:yes gene_type:complete